MGELQLADLAPRLLQMEREKGGKSFRLSDLTEVLYDSLPRNERRKQLIAAVAADPELSGKSRLFFLNHTQRYETGLRKSHAFVRLLRRLNLTDPQEIDWVYRSVGEPLPIDVHRSMFLPTLASQTTAEQQRKWLPLARNYQIIGAYAQTELGHGSNVQGIETTATFDETTQEFILNSPTLTSRKWWPGGLGKTANHAIVHAKLYLPSSPAKSMGIQAFIVPLRSSVTHEPLPGIEVGDIGPKIGFNAVDNGYLVMDHVRIPRENMLMRFAQVTPSGKFIKASNDKAIYFTMVFVRSSLLLICAKSMAMATVVTCRYSAVRVQGKINKSTQSSNHQNYIKENQVLSYQNQQIKLFPLVCLSYASFFAGKSLLSDYHSVLSRLNDPNVKLQLSELHATSSGLKSLVTAMVADGIESCRRLCGGHGYSQLSCLPHMFMEFVGACTYEGTFDVLVQQTSRFLFKAVRQLQQNPAVDIGHNLSYLKKMSQYISPTFKCTASVVNSFSSLTTLLEAFEVRSIRALHDATTCSSPNMMQMTQCATAHSELMLVRSFIEAAQKHQSKLPILHTMCVIFSLDLMLKSIGDFRHNDYMSSSQVDMCRHNFLIMLPIMRTDIIAVTDAWDFSDFELNSCIGKYDGDVYRALIEKVKEEPLNKTDVPTGYEEFLKPLFNARL